MSKIAIVGANAALSKYLIGRLKEEGNTIITVGRNNCDFVYDLGNHYEHLDFSDDIDIIVHVAACFAENTDDEICEIETVNALGTLNVCIAAKKAGIRHIILISSMNAALDKTSPYYNMYAISKRHAEDLATYYCKNNEIILSIIRPSQIYDDKGLFRKHQSLIYFMADSAQRNRDITIFGSYDAVRNYIYIDDLLELICRVILLKCEGVFHCIGRNIYLSDVAKAAIAAFNSSSQIKYLKEEKDIPDNGFIFNTSFYDLIQYKLQTDIIRGMKKIAAPRCLAWIN